MRKGEGSTMELVRYSITSFAVEEIIDQRMTDMRHVYSYLMCSSGMRYNSYRCITVRIDRYDLIFCEAFLASVSRNTLDAAFLLTLDRSVYESVRRCWNTYDLGYIFFAEFLLLHS